MHDCAKFCFFQQRPPVHRKWGQWQLLAGAVGRECDGWAAIGQGTGFQEASPAEGVEKTLGNSLQGVHLYTSPSCLRMLEARALEWKSLPGKKERESGWGVWRIRGERRVEKEKGRKKEMQREKEKGNEEGERKRERRKTGRQRREAGRINRRRKGGREAEGGWRRDYDL